MSDGISFLDFEGPVDPATEAKTAAKALAAAKHETRRRLGDFLANASSKEELIQRLAMREVDETLQVISDQHMGFMSDGKAKLARALAREWKVKKARAAALPKKDTPEWHEYQIALKTLRMPDAMVGVMGGPSKAKAQQIVDKYKKSRVGARKVRIHDIQGPPEEFDVDNDEDEGKVVHKALEAYEKSDRYRRTTEDYGHVNYVNVDVDGGGNYRADPKTKRFSPKEAPDRGGPGGAWEFQSRVGAEDNYRLTCPECNSNVPLASKKCPKCGFSPEESDRGFREHSRVGAEYEKCPKCGGVLYSNAADPDHPRCIKCGYGYEEWRKNQTGPPKKNSRTGAGDNYRLTCPECNANVPLASKKCPECGFSPEKSDRGFREHFSRIGVDRAEFPNWKCRECDTSNPWELSNCEGCGRLHSQVGDPPPGVKGPKKKSKVGVGIFGPGTPFEGQPLKPEDVKHFPTQGWGYMGHEFRTPETDKLLIDAANAEGFNWDDVAMWADSRPARHFMDGEPSTVEEFKQELRRTAPGLREEVEGERSQQELEKFKTWGRAAAQTCPECGSSVREMNDPELSDDDVRKCSNCGWWEEVAGKQSRAAHMDYYLYNEDDEAVAGPFNDREQAQAALEQAEAAGEASEDYYVNNASGQPGEDEESVDHILEEHNASRVAADEVPSEPATTPGISSEGAYRVDVLAHGETNWATNALTFATPEEAKEVGTDLAWRWLAVDDFRVVPVSTPKREPYSPPEGEGSTWWGRTVESRRKKGSGDEDIDEQYRRDGGVDRSCLVPACQRPAMGGQGPNAGFCEQHAKAAEKADRMLWPEEAEKVYGPKGGSRVANLKDSRGNCVYCGKRIEMKEWAGGGYLIHSGTGQQQCEDSMEMAEEDPSAEESEDEALYNEYGYDR